MKLSIFRDRRNRIRRRRQLEAIAEGVSAYFYVVDPESHELLYVNRRLRTALGIRQPTGRICHRTLFGEDTPCPFCPLDRVLRGDEVNGPQEEYSPVLDRWLLIIGQQRIEWPKVGTAVLNTAVDITALKRTGDLLSESRKRFQETADLLPVGVLETDSEGVVTYASSKTRELFKLSSRDLQTGVKALDLVSPAERERLIAVTGRILTGESRKEEGEFQGASRAGSDVSVILSLGSIYHEGRVAGVRMVVTENARVKSLQRQMAQMQRMESLGQLVGGVAHDLNNMLGPILGFSELLVDELGPEDPSRDPASEILQAGLRAKKLVRQLLAFGRRQTFMTEVADLNRVVQGMKELLRRTLREEIQLEIFHPAVRCLAIVDVSQVERVILNLVANAQDAILTGGTIMIETGEAVLDEEYARTHAGVTPGEYVMLSVTDTGEGMDRKTADSIFEPFFTTKTKGRGTGLGLAMVYGIVKQHHGNIYVYSEPSKGSCFKTYFPRAAEDAVDETARSPHHEPSRREGMHATVLIAEDDSAMRNLIVKILQKTGYTVLAGESGQECLELARSRTEPIALLVADVVMPGLSGEQLSEALASVHPETRVLYVSGYTDNVIVHHGILKAGITFLQKPFTAAQLLEKVHELVGGEATDAADGGNAGDGET